LRFGTDAPVSRVARVDVTRQVLPRFGVGGEESRERVGVASHVATRAFLEVDSSTVVVTACVQSFGRMERAS